jgi:hypothetical protein
LPPGSAIISGEQSLRRLGLGAPSVAILACLIELLAEEIAYLP